MYSTVIGNGRTLQEDMVLLGYKVPKGVRIPNSVELLFRLNMMILGPSRLSHFSDWKHIRVCFRA